MTTEVLRCVPANVGAHDNILRITTLQPAQGKVFKLDRARLIVECEEDNSKTNIRLQGEAEGVNLYASIIYHEDRNITTEELKKGQSISGSQKLVAHGRATSLEIIHKKS